MEHVGSTGVKGCYAKPIIDLDIVLYSINDFQSVKKLLELVGFEHRSDIGIPGRESFINRVSDYICDDHEYVCDPKSQKFPEHIVTSEAT